MGREDKERESRESKEKGRRDEVKAAELASSRIETQVIEKRLDVRDLEDQVLALVGEL